MAVEICLPIWRVDPIVENSGEAEADEALGSWLTMRAVTHVTPTVHDDRCERLGIEVHGITWWITCATQCDARRVVATTAPEIRPQRGSHNPGRSADRCC